MAVIIDSSVAIDLLHGERLAAVQIALAEGSLVLSPLVVTEVLSGDLTLAQRATFGEFLQDYPMHPTPLEHWINVGNLRRMLSSHGINATIPDATSPSAPSISTPSSSPATTSSSALPPTPPFASTNSVRIPAQREGHIMSEGYDKPSKAEDEYFARQEIERRKKWAQEQSSKMAGEEKERIKQLHYMKCPKCGMDLKEIDLHGVKVDQCANCGGIFLDAGEIEQLARQADQGLVGRVFSIFK